MSKFRKKPVVIDAVQFHADHPVLPDGVQTYEDRIGWFVQTLEGPLNVSPEDWIITGIRGEKYPCKPDIFEATYEPAD